MGNLVTIGIPVYRRLEYLAGAVRSVSAQDYDAIELIVSDNGRSGSEVSSLVEANYRGQFRFRSNPETVPASVHYNQLVDEASGEYFVLLCDDDEISPTFISTLIEALESDPQVGLAIPSVQVIDEYGQDVPASASRGSLPATLTSEEFIQAWCLGHHDFVCFASILARTSDIRSCGAYPHFNSANSVDNALVLKLCLGRQVAFSQDCAFRYRVYGSSQGLSVTYRGLAEAGRQFMSFLDSDPTLARYARAEPKRWASLRGLLRKMTALTYHYRWAHIYRERLSTAQWVRAAFTMPFVPAYYRAVAFALRDAALRRA